MISTMTASNLEPATSTTSGECLRDVTDRVTSASATARELTKRVTVSGELDGPSCASENDGNNNRCSPSASVADDAPTTCCREQDAASENLAHDRHQHQEQQPQGPSIRYQPEAVAHEQTYLAQLKPPPGQPHAISIYPPAHNFVHYPPFASAPPPPPPPPPPQLGFYHQPPFLTWTCPITGNYHHHHHQLLPPPPPPPPLGGHVYYHHPAQPFVAQQQHHQHHQLSGLTIYQQPSVDATNQHHQYVTQVAPDTKGTSDDDNQAQCQSHGSPTSSLPAQSNQISACNSDNDAAAATAAVGIGSSAAASLGCAHAQQAQHTEQRAQQSDKLTNELASSTAQSQPEPLDTTAALLSCGPIWPDDKHNARRQQSNKISYLNGSGSGCGGGCDEGSSQQPEGDNKEDDDDDERGSCQSSPVVGGNDDDDDGDEQRAVTRPAPLCNCARDDTCARAEPVLESAGFGELASSRSSSGNLLCSLNSRQDQTSTNSSTKSGGSDTCRDQIRAGASPGRVVNLMVKPALGTSSSSSSSVGSDEDDEDKQNDKEDKDEERVPRLKEANLDEHLEENIFVIKDQTAAAAAAAKAAAATTTTTTTDNRRLGQPTPTTDHELHQISINGTTFYNVDPARLFHLPAQQAILQQQQQQHQNQLPFLLSYYNLAHHAPHLANAYHATHLPAPQSTTSYHFQPAHGGPPHGSPYGTPIVYHHQQPQAWMASAAHHNPRPAAARLTQATGCYSEWLHHTASYQQHQLFGPAPYHGPPLRPLVFSHHSYDEHPLTQMPPPPPPLTPMQPQQLPPVPTTIPLVASSTSVSQLKLGYNLIPLLPIQAIPTRVRQAYGMDKVWQDEFEQLFAQFISQVVWTLVEVETNPNVRASSRILDYKNRYVVRVDESPAEAAAASLSACSSRVCQGGTGETREEEDDEEDEEKENDHHESEEEDEEEEDEEVKTAKCGQVDDQDEEDEVDEDGSCQNHSMMNERASNCESDCDSGAVLNSSTSGSSFETTCCQAADELSNTSNDSTGGVNGCSSTPMTEVGGKVNESMSGRVRTGKFPLKFRMFIDSAKVRFCCETCGHGWTSMKGRVVFWYELFELVDGDPPNRSSPSFKYASEQQQQQQQQHGVSNLIGYCAYKLFGQQCDVCKVENRFERPMWYPEEVTKVLCNLYNKIGQVYFGFRMPTIDKQRRAGKPKTSHNSLLCQACHDGVCTDRK